MKQQYIVHLQQELVQVFGHPVLSFSDCTKLSEEIFEKTGLKISVNTLRRFFGLITAKYPPSYNTLTILSKACGFQSYNEFTQVWDSKATAAAAADTVLLKFMVSLFQQIPVATVHDDTYTKVVRLTIIYLKSNQDLIDAFQKRIARTKNGQEYYFEHFVHTDCLASFYGDGLRYYLNERKEAKAQIFGNGLLCFRYWLTMNDHAFDNHYKKIAKYAVEPSLPSTIQARYFAARLFQAHIHHVPANPTLETVRSLFNQLAHGKENVKTFPQFEYILTAALVLTSQFEEALFYIGQVKKKRAKYAVPNEEATLFEGFDVYEAIAWAGLEKMEKAAALYERLATVKFYFLDQKYFSILVMYLERLLKKRTFREEKFVFLIKETGFKRLQVLFQTKVENRSDMGF